MVKFIRRLIYYVICLIEKYEYRKLLLDENNIDKKIINSLKVDFSVKTDNGYSQATDIHLTQPYKKYTIVLDNGYYIECADNHILFDENLNEIFAKDININSLLQTDMGIAKVVSMSKSNVKLSMFDITVNAANHRYYTNGILSHNTINAAITILHYMTFENDKNIMIVANKRDTVVEIIDKIKSIYTNLPFFLKFGVKNWNQQNIFCENGCKLRSAARSKTPALGFAIDFLYLDEFAHIPSNIIVPYYTAVYPTLTSIKNSRLIITSTPNGMNLFHKLLTDAQRSESDPLKIKFKSKMVYWYEVEGRSVTYFKLYDHKLEQYEIRADEILEQVSLEFKLGKVFMEVVEGTTTINVYNEFYPPEEVKKFIFKKNDKEYSIFDLSYVTSWKEETIKEIGSEDAFNQEYGLRFINSSRSLLNEAVIDRLIKSKKDYLPHSSYEFDRRIRFDYSDLHFIDDLEVYNPLDRNKIHGISSVDIAAGLGRDYSIINLFKIVVKPIELIELYKKEFTHLSDFFCLQQFGIYRSNLVSPKQLAELFYVIHFEFFNPEFFKSVVEYNEYGREFLAELPQVFDGNNDFASSIFFKYKHRVDALEESIGLKVTKSKDILVKDYQTNMNKGNFMVNNPITIDEITSFVKHETSSGNIQYKADRGFDDCVMTIVDASSLFSKHAFREMVESYASELVDKQTLKHFNSILNNSEFLDVNNDYNSLLSIRKRQYNKYNS